MYNNFNDKRKEEKRKERLDRVLNIVIASLMGLLVVMSIWALMQ